MGVMEGIPIHVSFSASAGFPWRYLFFLPCVPSMFRHLPSWQMCGNGRVVVKLPLFSKWNLTIVRLLALHIVRVCSDETGCTERFEVGLSSRDRCWAEEGSRYKGNERVRESFFFFFCGTWVKWKTSSFFFWSEGNHVSAARHWTLCSVVDSF